jgi:hypothetical protein
LTSVNIRVWKCTGHKPMYLGKMCIFLLRNVTQQKSALDRAATGTGSLDVTA